ncbi:hypothetical protein Q1695_001996 [Nippostrongylus brasiliensis]|nr:hypothetical protein Q1695_001996 [Nippostrongylus brasiliensis]
MMVHSVKGNYSESAWILIRGLSSELTEGDIITVFSQFGEVMAIRLLRKPLSGRSRGICFLCYMDRRSAILAVDNFSGTKLIGLTLNVVQYEVRLDDVIECAPLPYIRQSKRK